MVYSSDLSEKEFKIIEKYINYDFCITRPKANKLIDIINGIMYQLKNGCIWRDLPKDLPPYSTCFYYYKKWSKNGTLDLILEELHKLERIRVGKKIRTNGSDS